MSQPVYGYSPNDGYSIQQGFANPTQSSHSPSSNGITHGQLSQSENTLSSSYGGNHIPGLGLGTPRSGPVAHGSWSNSQPVDWRAVPQTSQNLQQPVQVLPKSNSTTHIPGLSGSHPPAVNAMELGEDGELEDGYEPMETQHDGVGLGGTSTAECLDNQSIEARGRSGSYSPFLSPQEISPPGNARTGEVTSEVSIMSPVRDDTQHRQLAPSKKSRPDSRTDLGKKKKQAQDAILRLWPLNIKFQNYITEGIDESLLKSLFKDLGLNLAEPLSESSNSNAKRPANSGETIRPEAISDETTSLSKPSSGATKTSEERKDRIARLLAAKGSKQQQTSAPKSTSAAPASPKPTRAESKSAKPTLTQSEKSRLLQQKVEALKKAQETLKQRQPILSDDKSDSNNNSKSTPEGPRATSRGKDTASENDVPASAIPGLSRSTNTQDIVPEAVQQTQTTLDASDLRYARLVPAFNQNMESRPFLIHVSDEEDDDEEMEIVSPVRLETPPNIPGTLGQQDGLERETYVFNDTTTTLQQIRSPVSIPTPVRSNSRNNGSDLETMNRQIEEMKRKIAEAEARKKAKSSRQGSPVLTQLNDSSVEDSSDTRDRPTPPAPRFYGKLGAVNAVSRDRRSLSRAASERLPLIEARRREQLIKLKALQSEVAKVELELQDAILEEERLKGEIMSSDSDKELEEAAPETSAELMSEPVPPNPTVSGERSMAEVTAHDEPIARADNSAGRNSESVSPAPTPPITDISNTEGVMSNLPGDDFVNVVMDISEEQEQPNGGIVTNSFHDSSDHSDGFEDIDMEDAGYSADEDVEQDSEGEYEPPDASPTAELSNNDVLEPESAEPLSTRGDERGDAPAADTIHKYPSGSDEVEGLASDADRPSSLRNSFVTNSTPLQYFHAYRFHPAFTHDVAGGLRSTTYSNKIDVKKALCPDELAGQTCPRGSRCDFQHFDSMQAPDDQILLQLGAADFYDETQKQSYIAGLKELLTDYRTHKVKDFNTISQGIVDYRAKFLGDKTKILPLGTVTL